MAIAGLLLCGGKSSRMGEPKGALQLFGKSFLEHCCSRMEWFEKWAAVGSQGASPPRDFTGLFWLNDEFADRGPLEGLRVGLKWAQAHANWAFVSTIDVPLFKPELADWLLRKADSGTQMVVPEWEGKRQGLTALYRCDLFGPLERLLESGVRKVSELPEKFETVLVPQEEILTVDPCLMSFSRINTPEDYCDFVKRCQESGLEGLG